MQAAASETRGESYFVLNSSDECSNSCYIDTKKKESCTLFPPWQKEIVFLNFGSIGLFVCLSVCLSVTNAKSDEQIEIKIYGGVWGGKTNT